MNRTSLISSVAVVVGLSLSVGAVVLGPRGAYAQTPPDASVAPLANPVPTDAGFAPIADAAASSAAVDGGVQETVFATSEEVPGLSVRRGRSDTVIDAPMEVVASAVTDVSTYGTIMPHVRDVRVVHRNHADTDVYMQVPLRGSLGAVWALVRVNVRRTPGRLELVGHAIDGNMERFESTTILERLPGPTPRTRVTFTLLALPRLPFPSSVFSREMLDAARTVATNLRNRIARTLADGG